MGLSDITDRRSILDAIAEFDHLTRHAFLAKYGFGRSKSYWLIHNGKRYDSKAIVGAAHGNARPDLGPLKAADFTGGEASVQSKLEQLGFTVEVNGGIEDRERSSTQLTPGSVYTRDDLRDLFEITDATLNTGVFRPKGTTSIWLFVTREKTADRTQYRDRFEGDTLYWQGQTSGRTDGMIIEHRARGLEILVFFRERKYEHPGAGFRFLGPFAYVSHAGAGPASFVLERQSFPARVISADAADSEDFDPLSAEDARNRISRTITQRRGQQAFRNALMAAYEGHCVVTDCSVHDVLEAAHIYPYRGPDTNKLTNGLLLRADLHTLFDCGLIAIDEVTMALIVAPQLRSSEYGNLHGRILRTPSNPAHRPSKNALIQHRKSTGL